MKYPKLIETAAQKFAAHVKRANTPRAEILMAEAETLLQAKDTDPAKKLLDLKSLQNKIEREQKRLGKPDFFSKDGGAALSLVIIGAIIGAVATISNLPLVGTAPTGLIFFWGAFRRRRRSCERSLSVVCTARGYNLSC